MRCDETPYRTSDPMIIAAGLVIALSALVQGAVGYGMALVAAPLLALVDPMLVPVPLILLTSGHALLAVIRDGRYADWPGIGWAMLGRLPGTGARGEHGQHDGGKEHAGHCEILS